VTSLLAKLAANKQATWSVVAYTIVELIGQVMDLWFPDLAGKTDETVRLCSKAIVGYAIIMTAHQPPATPDHITPDEMFRVPTPKGEIPPLTTKP